VDQEVITLTDFASATPLWLETFVAQYQMFDTSRCPETILNVQRSNRWQESQTLGGLDKKSRDSRQVAYVSNAPPSEHEAFLGFASECLADYLESRPEAASLPRFECTEAYNIIHYPPGGAYHVAHSDYAPSPLHRNRHISMVFFLNTIAEGGELEFVRQGLKVAPVEGRAVLFPTGWTHAHRSLPTAVDRYVIQMWWSFVEDAHGVESI